MELPLNTIAVVTELYQRILIQLIQWKCVWLKSIETHSSARVLLIYFQFVLSKLCAILFDINRR